MITQDLECRECDNCESNCNCSVFDPKTCEFCMSLQGDCDCTEESAVFDAEYAAHAHNDMAYVELRGV